MKALILRLFKIIYFKKSAPIFLKKIIVHIILFYRDTRSGERKKYTYPWCESGKIKLIGWPFFKDKDGYAYYAQYYEEVYIPDTKKIEENYMYKTEIYKAKLYNSLEEVKIDFHSDSLLPVAIPNYVSIDEKEFITSFFIDFYINEKKHKLEYFPQNRYHHIKLKKGDSCLIKSNQDILIGQPISLVQNKKNNKKLVLVIFIDAFSASLFEKYPLEELAPNTYEFFKKGVIFKNCYSNAEFTTPSLASMTTGNYVHKNNFFHPRIRQTIGTSQKMINQYFQEENYFTQLISGNYGQNPSQGYCQGYDRTIYKNSLKHQEIVYEFIESFRVFKDRDLFTWLSIFDVHHPLNLVPSFSAGAQMDYAGHNYAPTRDNLMTKTTFRTYCPKVTERHIAEIKKIDYHMKYLYDFIEQNFDDNNMLISLVSDHAASFVIDVKKKGPLLRKEKTNVPFMIRGTDFKDIDSTEIIENVDILPSILNACGISYEQNNIDGKLPKSLGGTGKEYIFSESIYPGQTYKATIKDEKYECFLEGKELTKDDGKINLSNYSLIIENIVTGEKINDMDIIKKYENIFLKILKNNIKNKG